MGDSEGTGKRTISERLNQLFERTPEGRPYSLREAANGINALAGENVVTYQYLQRLRKDDSVRPSAEKLQAIASWFGVPVGYFTDEKVARRTEEELRALEILRDSKVRHLTFRAATLNPDQLDLVVNLMDQLRSSGDLPSDSADDPDEKSSAPDGP